MDKLNIGVVGAGAWGKNLLRNVAGHPAARLTAICDTDAGARGAAAAAYPGTAVYNSFEAMLDAGGMEAVVVATPPRLHFRHAHAAIREGLHVLVEKPMCTSAEQAMALMALADTRPRVLMVGHTFLYSNLVQEVKRRIDAGELGEIHYIHSQRLNLGRVRQDLDALWNFAPHDISIASYLLDAWPAAVSARGACFVQKRTGIADVAFFQMDFPGDRFAAGHVSWLDPQKVRRTIVVGSEKMLVYDDINSQAHIQVYDKSVAVEFQASARDFNDFRTRVNAGDLVIPNIRLIEPLSVEIGHFVDCIRTGTPPRTGGEHGHKAICVLEALTESMASGGGLVPVSYKGGTQARSHGGTLAGMEGLGDQAIEARCGSAPARRDLASASCLLPPALSDG